MSRIEAMLWLGVQMNRLLRSFGLQLTRSVTPADRRRARLMQRYGITTVVDIGANTGQYATLLRENGFTGRIQSYEPLPEAFARLKDRASGDPRWTPVNQAVGEWTTTRTMHVAANSVSSSMLPIAERHRQAAQDSETVAEVTVECTRLDSILAPLAGESVMVKADTQGLELPILRSAADFLRNVRLIEIEMSLAELYTGQALFREVDAFLLSHGFALKSLDDGFFDAETGELLQVDAVYGSVDQ